VPLHVNPIVQVLGAAVDNPDQIGFFSGLHLRPHFFSKTAFSVLKKGISKAY
jgi:hypothetical protein